VKPNDPETLSRLLADGVVITRVLERGALAYADDRALATIGRMGIECRVLDREAAAREHFILVVPDAALLTRIAAPARVLHTEGALAVVSVPEGFGTALPDLGFETERVFRRPIRLSTAPPPRIMRLAKSLSYEAIIQQMVDRVATDSINNAVQALQNFTTRQANTAGAAQAALWLDGRFREYGIANVYLDDWSPTYVENVVAEIPGVGLPEEIVIVGAHFDSYTGQANNAPGADDNASGTSGILEIARSLAPYEFTRTIRFVAFSAEEYGLYGSEAYASACAAVGENIVAMLNLDMIGYRSPNDPRDLDIISNGASLWMQDLAYETAALYVPGFPIVNGYISGGTSDHQSFWGSGFDAIFFFEDSDFYSPYIHTVNDVVGTSYLDSNLATKIVKCSVALVATLADPFDVAMAHMPLGNTTDVANPYAVTATIRSALPLATESLAVRWMTGGVWSWAPLAPTATPDEYAGEIAAQVGGTWVNYYLEAEDTAGNRVTHPADAPASVNRFFVGEIASVWNDDFEADRGWIVGAGGDNATSGIWERGDPVGTSTYGPVPEDDHTMAPGVNCLVTGRLGGSASAYDVDNGKTTATSPAIDLSAYASASVSVAYWRWYTNDLGSAPGQDTWLAQVSSDGLTWRDLENSTAGLNQWTRVERNIDSLVTLNATVRIRFVASDLSPGSLVEAAIDDIAILVYQDAPTGVPGGELASGARATLGANQPNPFNPHTTIPFALTEPGRARLAVYDLAGRLVRVLVDARVTAGAHTASWDGTNAAGDAVGSGVYLYRLEAGRSTETRRMMLLK
jgi:hypothetical protein